MKYVLYNEHVYGSISTVSYTAPGESRVIRAMETLPQSRHSVRKKDLSCSHFLFHVPQRHRCRLDLRRWDQSGTGSFNKSSFFNTAPVSFSISFCSFLASLFCDGEAVPGVALAPRELGSASGRHVSPTNDCSSTALTPQIFPAVTTTEFLRMESKPCVHKMVCPLQGSTTR